MFEKNSVLSYSLKLVDIYTLVASLKGYLKFVFFEWFLGLVDFSWKIIEKCYNEEKRLKLAIKVIQPAFGCAKHPKGGQNMQQNMMKMEQLPKFKGNKKYVFKR